MAALWLLQAVTGMMIVFHWEEDDATIVAPHAPTDPAALERRIAALAPAGSGHKVTTIWTSAGFADRYDITVADSARGTETVVRTRGDGVPIRTTTPGTGHWIDTIVVLHQSLLSGPAGRTVMGISGLLLLTNIVGGLVIAWPRRGTWRKVLSPSRKGPPIARHYGWHRAMGLAVAAPALLLVGAGVLLSFDDSVGALIGATPVAMPAHPGTVRIGFADAVTRAEAALPGSRLTAVDLPTADDATYKVRLRARGEWRRAYGSSFVFVDAESGAVRGVFPASKAPAARAVFDALFPIHTGEAGGVAGRLLVLCTGLWLASMVVIGVRLWWLRRRPGLRAR